MLQIPLILTGMDMDYVIGIWSATLPGHFEARYQGWFKSPGTYLSITYFICLAWVPDSFQQFWHKPIFFKWVTEPLFYMPVWQRSKAARLSHAFISHIMKPQLAIGTLPLSNWFYLQPQKICHMVKSIGLPASFPGNVRFSFLHRYVIFPAGIVYSSACLSSHRGWRRTCFVFRVLSMLALSVDRRPSRPKCLPLWYSSTRMSCLLQLRAPDHTLLFAIIIEKASRYQFLHSVIPLQSLPRRIITLGKALSHRFAWQPQERTNESIN